MDGFQKTGNDGGIKKYLIHQFVRERLGPRTQALKPNVYIASY